MSMSMQSSEGMEPIGRRPGTERRRHRRHLLNDGLIHLDRWDDNARVGSHLGTVVDLSAGGVRVRTRDTDLKPGMSVKVRLRLPVHAGICPFVSLQGSQVRPSNEWIGWMSIERRIERADGRFELGGRLVGMEELDRGMLGLYLSIQPLAA